MLLKILLVTISVFINTILLAQYNPPGPPYPTQFTVAHDGSGNYKTIQEAINNVRDLSQMQVIIFIKNGVYKEKLVIPSWKTKITLKGENKDSTIKIRARHIIFPSFINSYRTML